MKVPSAKRLVASTLLIVAGLALLVYICDRGDWLNRNLACLAWHSGGAAIGAGIGVLFPKPIRSALIGAAMGAFAAFVLLQCFINAMSNMD